MTRGFIEALTRTVQNNCDIVDARHGTEMGMCAYLLKMREFYRWEKGYGLREPMPRAEIGEWLTDREARWQTLADAEFEGIRLDGRRFDPFDAEGVNEVLEPLGLVYSAGYIGAGTPHFMLAHLESVESPAEGYAVRVCSRELARGLSAPPALSLERSIFLRREALRRYLWERLEIWRWKSPRNALARAFDCYDFEDDPDGALDAMTDTELRPALQHELGELEVTGLLGEDWHRMLSDLLGTPAEVMARAVRDCLADCLRTLPYLAEQGRSPSLHFFVGTLTAMRREIFPGLVGAYDGWAETGDTEPFEALAGLGRNHWLGVSREMLRLHGQHGRSAVDPIVDLVEENRL